MDFSRTSLLYLALMVLLCFAVVVCLIGLMFYQQTTASLRDRLAELERADRQMRRAAAAVRPPSTTRQQRGFDQFQRRLNQLQAALKRKTDSYNKLKAEFDSYVALTGELLESPGGQRRPNPQLKQKMAKLEAQARKDQEQQGREDLESVALQMSAEQELESLVTETQTLLSAASEALVRIGQPAVPVLTELLSDQQQAVREWAAYVLGQIQSNDSGQEQEAEP